MRSGQSLATQWLAPQPGDFEELAGIHSLLFKYAALRIRHREKGLVGRHFGEDFVV